MGYALMWVESLATVLVLVAAVTAVAAHWRRFGRRVAPVVVAVVLIAVAAAGTVSLCHLHFVLDAHPISNPQSLAAIAWTLFLAAGSVVVLVRGLPGPEPAARAWSRSKLALA